MKNLIKKSLILVGAAASVTAVASDVDLTYKQAENGKYGYVDKSGNWVVEPTFDDCSYFGDTTGAIKIALV